MVFEAVKCPTVIGMRDDLFQSSFSNPNSGIGHYLSEKNGIFDFVGARSIVNPGNHVNDIKNQTSVYFGILKNIKYLENGL